MSKRCPKGKILRNAYTRKAHWRTVNSKRVRVPETFVPETCVPDMGNPGKGKKTLPQPRDDLHLSWYGYSINKSQNVRRRALRQAAKDHGARTVLGRLNLLRNLQPIPENKAIFTEDVEYAKDLYDPERKTTRAPKYDVWNNPKERKRLANPNNSKSRRKKNQRGGNDDNDNDYDEIIGTRIQTVYQKVCDSNGCQDEEYVEETHEINNKTITFSTIRESDVNTLRKFDPNFSLTKSDNSDSISVRVNNTIQGYAQFTPIDNYTMKITKFIVNKGNGSLLYSFLNKYFQAHDYHRIVISVDLDTERGIDLINFFYKHGFSVDKKEGDLILLHKYLSD